MSLFKSFSAASLSFFPALISYFLVARAILDKNESDLRYAFGLLIIFAICWLASFSWMPERPHYTMAQKTWRLATLVVPALFIFPMTVVVLIFGEVDMAAFVFHLVFGLAGGTPWDDMAPFLVTALVFWIVFCASLWRTQVWLDKLPVTWFLIAGAVVAINPLVYDLGTSRISSSFTSQKSLLEEYQAPEVIENTEYPNLIILYLEGLERSYLEHPSLSAHMPEMNALAATNPNLTNVHQLFGTGWSLAGNLSTQCGVPVLPFGARSLGEFSEIREIMPNVTCLGDVLANRGYDQSYASTTKIIGNKMGYYGFDNLYSTHRFDTVIDRDTIVASRGSLSPRSEDPQGWGIFDGEMFPYMLDYIAEKAAADRPFSVVMATMDTHGPQGLISPQCAEHGVGEYSDDMRDALRCTSQMVDQFLRDLALRIDMNKTKVVIMSDHLAHRNNLTPILETGSRRNMVMLLDGPNSLRVEAPSSMIDVYPTILDWLGLLAPGKPKAGLGVSLLSQHPTLIEAYGIEEVNTRLRVDVELARFIWR